MAAYVLALTTKTKTLVSGESVGLVAFAFKLINRDDDKSNRLNERAYRMHVGPSERAWQRRGEKGVKRPTLWVRSEFEDGHEVYAMWEHNGVAISDTDPVTQVGVLRKQGRGWTVEPV